jgi:hypothetical protein
MPKMPANQITVSAKPRGRPKLTEAEKLRREMKKNILRELSPLTQISDTLKAAMWALAEGRTIKEAANIAGMAENSLRTRLAEPDGKAAMRATHETFLEEHRGKLRRKLLAQAGVLDDETPDTDPDQQFRACIAALGMLGDSDKAAAMRVRWGDRTYDPLQPTPDDGDEAGPIMPQLVINISGTNATADTVTIEHGDE